MAIDSDGIQERKKLCNWQARKIAMMQVENLISLFMFKIQQYTFELENKPPSCLKNENRPPCKLMHCTKNLTINVQNYLQNEEII